jgi:hypothetical protein
LAIRYAIPAALALTLSAAAAAATDKPACPAAAHLPAEWRGWAEPVPAPADSRLVPGTAYRITLAPMAGIELTGVDGKELPEGSRGAVFTLDVAEPGRYRVTVADPMWIDLVGPEGVVESVAHGHGPDCSGLGKIVSFPLDRGTYRLELSAAEVPMSAVMALGPEG